MATRYFLTNLDYETDNTNHYMVKKESEEPVKIHFPFGMPTTNRACIAGNSNMSSNDSPEIVPEEG